MNQQVKFVWAVQLYEWKEPWSWLVANSQKLWTSFSFEKLTEVPEQLCVSEGKILFEGEIFLLLWSADEKSWIGQNFTIEDKKVQDLSDPIFRNELKNRFLSKGWKEKHDQSWHILFPQFSSSKEKESPGFSTSSSSHFEDLNASFRVDLETH